MSTRSNPRLPGYPYSTFCAERFYTCNYSGFSKFSKPSKSFTKLPVHNRKRKPGVYAAVRLVSQEI